MPRSSLFLKCDLWAKEYGPLVGLKFGPTNAVLINDASLIHELLVKRGASFNARPPRYIAQEHVIPEGRHTYVLFIRSDYSRRVRTISKEFLIGDGLFELAPMQKAAGTRLAYNLLQSGDEWMEYILQWGVSTPVAMLSGAPVQDFGESWIHDYHDYLELFEELLDPATSPPVDVFPVLRWVPAMFAEWKRKAPIARRALLHAFGVMMTHAKQDRQGSFPSLIPKLLRQASDPSTPPEERISEVDIKCLMGGMLDAAVDSSVVTFQTIILALISHPDAQCRAQAEIDAVFGSDQGLPDKIDLEKLPYLNACVTEALRWRPVSVINLPRETVVDEDILGYHIPKGTTVLLNHWTIQQDPDFYEAPERYDPERFLRDPFGAKDGVSQQGRKTLYTFGAGRRECPGKDFFFQNMRIALAQVLWAFDLVATEPLDIDVKTGFTASVMLRPKPFKVKFVPRSMGTREALVEEKRKADIVLSEILG
ncbi:hypothetical protein MMC11_002610 [Xylographa trunciseda]|nr:hypothetical protein [Xylographa trunciseda]